MHPCAPRYAAKSHWNVPKCAWQMFSSFQLPSCHADVKPVWRKGHGCEKAIWSVPIPIRWSSYRAVKRTNPIFWGNEKIGASLGGFYRLWRFLYARFSRIRFDRSYVLPYKNLPLYIHLYISVGICYNIRAQNLTCPIRVCRLRRKWRRTQPARIRRMGDSPQSPAWAKLWH